MSSNVKIMYINQSMNMDLPKVFVFVKNEVPTFDALKEGVAWKVIEDVGRESTCKFIFPIQTEICSSWNDGSCSTRRLPSEIGARYIVDKNDTGIVLEKDGNAGNTRSIDVCNNVNVDNGISVDLYKDGRIMMTKNIVGYGQKATFNLHPKLYWGLASEIVEGEQISSAVLNSDHFFELNLEGVSNVTIALCGNAEIGYQFEIISQS